MSEKIIEFTEKCDRDRWPVSEDLRPGDKVTIDGVTCVIGDTGSTADGPMYYDYEKEQWVSSETILSATPEVKLEAGENPWAYTPDLMNGDIVQCEIANGQKFLLMYMSGEFHMFNGKCKGRKKGVKKALIIERD